MMPTYAVWLPLWLLLGLSGCGGSAPEQSLTLELGGKPLAFNARLCANDPPTESVVHFVTVGGQLENDPMSPGFMFQLVGDDIRPGTYTTGSSELHASYYVQTNGGTMTYFGGGSDGTRFVLTVESMSEQGVQGTFSGRLRKSGSADPGIFLTVANGRFSANYNGR